MKRCLVLMVLVAGAFGTQLAAQTYKCELGSYVSPPPPPIEESETSGLDSPHVINVHCRAGMVAVSVGPGVSESRPSRQSPAPAECSPVAGAPTGLYCYAGAAQAFTGIGAAGSFGIYAPVVAPGDFHSLAEVSVSCCQTTTPAGQQIVEAGWIVDPKQFGDSGTHLFVNAWRNLQSLGYNNHFIINQTATHSPGELLPITATPTPFIILLSQGNWWVWFSNSWLGHFQADIWAGKFAHADSEEWFGEVAASTPLPSTTMGNGIAGTQTGSAQVTSMQVYGPTGAPQVAMAAANVTNASLYSVGGESGSPFSAFQYGGQGDPPTKVLFSAGGLYVTSGKPGAAATNLSTNLLASGEVTNFGDKALIFGLDKSFQSSLWVSDGTPAGTNELSKVTIPTSDYPFVTVVSALKKAFFWCDDSSQSVQLCVTDGTAAGTLQLTSISGGVSELPVPAMAALANAVLFPGLTSTGDNDLWVSDGTTSGTFPLTNTSINPSEVVVSNGIGYFSATIAGQSNSAIWESNGSSSGTYVLDASINPYFITPVAGGVAFVGVYENFVTQLYKSDGTLIGTVALGGTDPHTIAAFGSKILFDDISSPDDAYELFLSTGAPGGITQLTNSNTAPGFDGAAQFFSVLGNEMLFANVDSNETLSLWDTNGSVVGTKELASSKYSSGLYPGSLVIAGERAFFSGYDSSDEQQLWVTNGTTAGTVQLTSSRAGGLSVGPVLFGSKVLFVADDFDLWVSNGTTKGTLKVMSSTGSPITTITVLPN